MADNLRLRVVLDMAERVVAPLKKINAASQETANALKGAKDKLKELEKAHSDAKGFQRTSAALRSNQRELTQAQAKAAQYGAALQEQRERHANITASLRAAKHGYNQITTAYQDGKIQGAEYTRQIELARITLLRSQQAHEKSLASVNRYKAQVKNAGDRVAGLSQSIAGGTERLAGYKMRLEAAGISTERLAAQKRGLKSQMDAANTAIDAQKQKLQALGRVQDLRAKLAERHGQAMMHLGMAAAGSAALMAGGNKMAGPLRSVVGAFVPAENSETQLRASMMTNTGAVGSEYKQVLDLATRLGDRLPGTTADFIDMMTMLRRQGMTSQAILGGLGESAAYLGIQLRMPVTAAAEFAAKMQDATQTAERDMMGLMDTIQRAYYLGVDPTNMLQGFKNMGAVMPYLGKKGLEASQQLAPLLVMMDQAGMAGEAAGNAIRKVVQLSLDSEKLAKTNRMLAGEGVELNFATKGGKFAGLDNLFEQLDKLKGIDSDVKRIAAMKKLFGDDSETHQVLNTMMEKGLDGYREVVAKMQAQADLRKRVDEQLKTVSAAAEAAQGSFTNMLKDMGATIAPDLVLILNKLGALANSIGTWARENQNVVKWGLRVVGVLSALAIGAGALGLALASVLGPMMISRFLLARLVLSLGATRTAAATAAQSTGLLARMWAALGSALTRVGPWLVRMGPWLAGASKGVWAWGAKLATAVPVVLRFALALMRLVPVWGWLATAAMMWFQNWEGIKGGWLLLWEDLSQSASNSIRGLVQGLGWLKGQFFAIGGNLMEGMAGGIVAGVGAVANAINGVAESTMAWFREKLGIASPSKVFMQYGGWISEGAALGIAGGQGAVRTAALAVAAAAAMPMQAAALVPPDTAVMQAAAAARPLQAAAVPSAAGVAVGNPGAALRMDTRPPLAMPAAQAAQPAAGGGTYHITINAAPGMDEKALARAVAAEVQRIERAKRSRVLSAMSDID